jgi:S-phase kinase-associated protein 1
MASKQEQKNDYKADTKMGDDEDADLPMLVTAATTGAASASSSSSSSFDLKIGDDDETVGLDVDQDRIVKIKSINLNKTFELSLQDIQLSKKWKTAFNNDSSVTELEEDTKEICLPELEHVIHWLKHYHGTWTGCIVDGKISMELPRPLKVDQDLKDLFNEFDYNFTQALDVKAIFSVMLTANALDIHPLLHLMSATIASKVKGKTPEQIRQTFNMSEDFTPQEEDQAKREYAALME